MLRRNVVVAAIAVAGLIAIASPASAQNPQRRERLRKAAEAGVAVGAEVAENAADGGGMGTFNGHAIIMLVVPREEDATEDEAPAKEVNVGGLLILQVDDTGSRPTKFKKVTIEPEGAFQRLGRVQGIGMDEKGKDLMGGGYTWLLLKPTKVGEAKLTIKYTPNEGDGKEVTWTGSVNVVEQKK